MKKSTGWGRAGLVLAACVATISLWGCPNPNAIGVQQYGLVKVTCVLASNNQPVAGVLVSISGLAGTTDSSGTTTIAQVPIGTHTIQASGAGLDGNSPSVTVIENQTVSATVLMSPSQ